MTRGDDLRRIDIGEASTNCSQQLKDQHPDVDWAGIAGLRVVLAHHYHRTQPELIWQFASVEAPALRTSLES